MMGFDCGHVLPSSLRGSNSQDNLYCQNAEINQMMCYTIEKDLNKLLMESVKESDHAGSKVKMQFLAEFNYDNPDFPTIPSSINYGYRLFRGNRVRFETTFNLPNPPS
ncbi:hypothetical protein WR25_02398 [Diploscapter pachys]|uniref:Uncharacterized protein n=1 Tax=Diploscapter pachys TaxID=2018661 RepID=A0A2A2LLV8_9BILA|nr:hypothetical protein WR25_02398 [Diploscapter pachys]